MAYFHQVLYPFPAPVRAGLICPVPVPASINNTPHAPAGRIPAHAHVPGSALLYHVNTGSWYPVYKSKKMKTILAFWLLAVGPAGAYSQKTMPDVEVRDLEGHPFSSTGFGEEGKPVLLVFWATWCTHTKDGLTSINDDYLNDWKDEFGLEIVAVSVDDTRNLYKVKPYVHAKGWEFEVYTDANGDFRRAMNVNNAPHFLLLDTMRQVVWQLNSFAPGDEETIYQELLKL